MSETTTTAKSSTPANRAPPREGQCEVGRRGDGRRRHRAWAGGDPGQPGPLRPARCRQARPRSTPAEAKAAKDAEPAPEQEGGGQVTIEDDLR
jgi:hypothetical protein